MAAPGEPLNVLMVEDEPGDAELALWHLREAGLEPSWRRVETEEGYRAALAEPPDVILCDHRLPQFGSERALELLGQLGLDVPFIIVSGALGEEEAVAAMRLGAADYLLKDRLTRLGSAVRRAVEDRRMRAEKLRVEQQLRESEKLAEEKLRRAQRLESIGTLAAGIAHDFNNVLGIILGHVALAQEPGVDPARRERSLEAVRTAAERAAGLVHQILTFAGKTKLRLQPLDLNRAVEELARLVHETFPRAVEIRLELAPDLPPVRADSTLVYQVLLNLCLNARDAMPSGGLLTLRTSTAERPGDAPGHAVLSVSDQGTGMDRVTLARIFDPFFTTKEPGKGTGLGLAVAHSVMQSHGGLIDVESSPGRGTTFTLMFPITTEAPVEAPAPAPPWPAGSRGRGERILVAEDEETLLAAMAMALEDCGYSVIPARTGTEALSAFQDNAREVALVITDMEMPGIGGRELVTRLRALDPLVRVMFSTGHLEPLEAAELEALGVADILQKPFLPADLVSRVAGVLRVP